MVLPIHPIESLVCLLPTEKIYFILLNIYIYFFNAWIIECLGLVLFHFQSVFLPIYLSVYWLFTLCAYLPPPPLKTISCDFSFSSVCRPCTLVSVWSTCMLGVTSLPAGVPSSDPVCRLSETSFTPPLPFLSAWCVHTFCCCGGSWVGIAYCSVVLLKVYGSSQKWLLQKSAVLKRTRVRRMKLSFLLCFM